MSALNWQRACFEVKLTKLGGTVLRKTLGARQFFQLSIQFFLWARWPLTSEMFGRIITQKITVITGTNKEKHGDLTGGLLLDFYDQLLRSELKFYLPGVESASRVISRSTCHRNE